MRLAEIINSKLNDSSSLLFHLLDKLLKTHTVNMLMVDGIADRHVEIVEVEDHGPDVMVGFGIPNERTGDIPESGWRTEYIDADTWTVSKDDKGEWWLHEIE